MKWLKYDCVEVFILHKDTNAIGTIDIVSTQVSVSVKVPLPS